MLSPLGPLSDKIFPGPTRFALVRQDLPWSDKNTLVRQEYPGPTRIPWSDKNTLVRQEYPGPTRIPWSDKNTLVRQEQRKVPIILIMTKDRNNANNSRSKLCCRKKAPGGTGSALVSVVQVDPSARLRRIGRSCTEGASLSWKDDACPTVRAESGPVPESAKAGASNKSSILNFYSLPYRQFLNRLWVISKDGPCNVIESRHSLFQRIKLGITGGGCFD
jgi:hypothetical protein